MKFRYLYIGLILMIIMAFVPKFAFAYTNEANHWGIPRAKSETPPDAGKKFMDLLRNNGGFYLGDTTKKDIYLTFDNGYENGYTEKILDVLKEKKVPATFFVTGHYVKGQKDLLKRMVNEGHIIGNHSQTHPDLTTVNDAKLKEELQSVTDEIKKVTKQKEVKYLRPPRGIFSERTLALAKEMGYYNVFWSLAFIDWKVDEQRGWQYAYDNVMNMVHPGAIILLHAVSKDNAEALAKIIDDLREKGYHFKSLDDLVKRNQP
ncbi:delta-lactam-biosynthetic de-N-acetylase [Bacillus cytotoxicus]|uniref:Delta-lactam-biosynthetic de-N-acetylase n=2 Tax=Bacillus cytotoxicus TaxID=580165 RepID=A0AAX2CC82_9BACI|nr:MULTISPECIES: delta-lactam-biosynthetic de-N-acetylase [Bacillus cereus group]ABS20766.1 Delta-lactam-biosynthetic de-N-acetylase [Bacillus cytotoxicus NVH 391-98]AWC27403.1 delta-lactam-biosynthetic de-N-acetylase [Bacillus cytotoxicus]AWC31430.1 delta-lactam-biosynthetic de-N-acetylase [Bacillus cytotoxicus]AWC35470.1 delta-lactam-biosynthetic de-N-acetylase [Bacillus cytotoxicus]AWC41222.1 delta-lactam-biosynthetic de-N-acetylase [Bacillus cytotoxicus]